MSNKSLNTNSPFLMREEKDLDYESINKVLEWITKVLKDIEVELKNLDDRVTALE